MPSDAHTHPLDLAPSPQWKGLSESEQAEYKAQSKALKEDMEKGGAAAEEEESDEDDAAEDQDEE